ncbi:MAG: type II secretion system protein [Steroidobacteraceae bacterium]
MILRREARGFTLIELIITVAIIGLLASAAFPLAQMVSQRIKEQQLRVALRDIRNAIDAYKLAVEQGHVTRAVDASGYPPSLDVLVEGTEDLLDPNLRPMYFLRRMPRNPFFPDASADAADTWGLRSYESPPQDPAPGDDVYDVYALSGRTALDGSHYSDW